MIASLPFKPAPRETKADESGDTATVDRRLKTRIYLVTREKETELWQFPTVPIKKDETLLQAAQRAIAESAGPQLELYCPSNCPMAVDLVPYTEEKQQESGKFGEKIFFMRVQRDEGKVKVGKASEFAWLTREELAEHMEHQQNAETGKFYHYML